MSRAVTSMLARVAILQLLQRALVALELSR